VPDFLALGFDELSTEVFFCCEAVVGSTENRQVCCHVPSISGEGCEVMQLQAASLTTTLAPWVDVAAPGAVSFEHHPALGCWNVPDALARGF
jgi:hypothetical protein